MRLNELVGKEVINLTDAARLGVIKNAQALVNTDTGGIEALLVPFSGARGLFGPRPKVLAIPWRAIRRFGRDIVIVEVKTPVPSGRRPDAITV